MGQRNGQSGAGMLPPREGSIVGQGPIDLAVGQFNPKGQSPTRRGTPEGSKIVRSYPKSGYVVEIDAITMAKRHLKVRLDEFLQAEATA